MDFISRRKGNGPRLGLARWHRPTSIPDGQSFTSAYVRPLQSSPLWFDHGLAWLSFQSPRTVFQFVLGLWIFFFSNSFHPYLPGGSGFGYQVYERG